MAFIYTRRNYVSVGKVLPGERYVVTFTHTPDGGRSLICTQPIEKLESALRWAMEMADHLVGPIELVTVPSEDELLRKIVIAIGFEGLWREDPEEQKAGRDLLISMGEFKQ